MCIDSSTSFLSTFLLALSCFIGIWNYKDRESFKETKPITQIIESLDN